jgi:phosphatidylinositol alpha-1,6-mannosyltransferase
MVRRRRLEDSVLFVSSVEWCEMPLVYSGANLYCLPCRTRLLGLEAEAFGMAFLEAAAAGLPVIGGHSGGAAETLSGLGGTVVDPRSRAAISSALTRRLSQTKSAADETVCG